MSLTILLLMLSGIVPQINGQGKCTKLEGEKECCKAAKPIKCAFQPPSKVTDDCKCLPKTTNSVGGVVVSVCIWNNQLHLSTNDGTSVPCTPKGADGACSMNDTRVNPPDTACHHYPPPASVFESQDGKYCEFMETETDLLPDEKIYDVYFTCWLYDCGNRLEKTNKTLERELKWCYPPVLPGNGLKFCPLYVHDATTNIYKATPFTSEVAKTDSNSSNSNVTETSSMAKGCVLPPICKGEIVDKTKYMLPWNGGKADTSHCERLCPKVGPNNGKSSQEPDVASSKENRCRMLPTCGNEEKYNRFQVSDYATNCRNWCTPNSTHYMAKDTKDANCNAKPLCKLVNGAYVKVTDKPFSVNNPYGAEECDTPTTCNGAQTEDTHHCTKNASGEGDGGGEDKGSFPIWVVAVGIGALVLLVVVGLVVYFVFFRKRKSGEASKTLDPENASAALSPATPKDKKGDGKESQERNQGKSSKKGSKKDSKKDSKKGSKKEDKKGSEKKLEYDQMTDEEKKADLFREQLKQEEMVAVRKRQIATPCIQKNLEDLAKMRRENALLPPPSNKE